MPVKIFIKKLQACYCTTALVCKTNPYSLYPYKGTLCVRSGLQPAIGFDWLGLQISTRFWLRFKLCRFDWPQLRLCFSEAFRVYHLLWNRWWARIVRLALIDAYQCGTLKLEELGNLIPPIPINRGVPCGSCRGEPHPAHSFDSGYWGYIPLLIRYPILSANEEQVGRRLLKPCSIVPQDLGLSSGQGVARRPPQFRRIFPP